MLGEAGLDIRQLVDIARAIIEGRLAGPAAGEYSRLLRRANVEYRDPASIALADRLKAFYRLMRRGELSYTINRVTLSLSYVGLDGVDFDDAQRLLAFMHSLGIAKAAIKSRFMTCPKCGSQRLIVHLVCSRCGSRRLRKTRIIHHRLCGYVGREDEFEEAATGQGLVCPRCGTPLREEGVDYEVVGEVYVCEDCGALVRRPEVLLECASCGHEFPYHEGVYKGVMTAEPTALGEALWLNAAVEVALFEDALRRRGVQNIQVPGELSARGLAAASALGLQASTPKILLEAASGRTGRRAAAVFLDTLRRYDSLDSFISSTLNWFVLDAIRRYGRFMFIVIADDEAGELVEAIRSHGVIASMSAQSKALGRKIVVGTPSGISPSILERHGIGVILVAPMSGADVVSEVEAIADLAVKLLSAA
ncbi:MAG: hypothetical protein GSR80_000232 [Desulfurococcales archaeon]|nr:hypothetical protein [Desulfurococcales archaeon]